MVCLVFVKRLTRSVQSHEQLERKSLLHENVNVIIRRKGVVRTSCERRANVVRTSCERRANVVRTSCERRANVVRTRCACYRSEAIHAGHWADDWSPAEHLVAHHVVDRHPVPHHGECRPTTTPAPPSRSGEHHFSVVCCGIPHRGVGSQFAAVFLNLSLWNRFVTYFFVVLFFDIYIKNWPRCTRSLACNTTIDIYQCPPHVLNCVVPVVSSRVFEPPGLRNFSIYQLSFFTLVILVYIQLTMSERCCHFASLRSANAVRG